MLAVHSDFKKVGSKMLVLTFPPGGNAPENWNPGGKLKPGVLFFAETRSPGRKSPNQFCQAEKMGGGSDTRRENSDDYGIACARCYAVSLIRVMAAL